ncbi:MAG: hypothetical protein WC784_01980 [Candidatus Shapirobacteria bacterium]|jgi:hypothetical protein
MKKIKKINTPIVEIKKKKVKKIKKKVLTPQIIVETVVEAPVVKKTIETKIHPELVTFYGNSIRNTFMNNQWYFSLEDILKVAKVVDPTKMLIELKNLESIKDKYYHLVETFSYYEGDSPIIIPVVNYQNFMEILPSIRQMAYFMPGPFPDWLKNAANRKF